MQWTKKKNKNKPYAVKKYLSSKVTQKLISKDGKQTSKQMENVKQAGIDVLVQIK